MISIWLIIPVIIMSALVGAILMFICLDSTFDEIDRRRKWWDDDE